MKKVIGVSFLLILSLSSCSNLGLGYKFSDDWIAWQIDDLFDLTDKQETFVDERLDQLKSWHKKNELPRYVAFLDKLKTRIKDQAPVLDWAQTEMKMAQKTLVNYMLADTVVFLSGVSSKQWQNFQAYSIDRAKERKLDVQDKTALERWQEGAEDWVGKLTPSQNRFISEQFKNSSKNYQDLQYQHTLMTAQQFQKAVLKGDQAFIKQWFMGELPSSLAEYEAIKQQRADSTQKVLAYLLETLTPTQRNHLYEALDELSESIEDIYR